MWQILGFVFAVAVFFFGYAIGWAHGRDDLLEQQACERGEGPCDGCDDPFDEDEE